MIDNKCKICRRLGQKLFLKGERCSSPKCAMVKRAYPPGPERKKRRGGALSNYGKTLREKQGLKNWYGLSEHQFKKYVKETLARRGRVENLAEEFIKRLEKRLDSVVLRLGFAKSRVQARQFVSHGHFLVNNKPVNIPSFELEKGDIVTIKEKNKTKAVFKDLLTLLKKKQVPSWLELNREKIEGKLTGEPSLEEVVPPAEISTIFEFYSR